MVRLKDTHMNHQQSITFLVRIDARKHQSTTTNQGSRYLARITVSGDESNALHDMI